MGGTQWKSTFIGSSNWSARLKKSVEDAIEKAIARAASTTRNLRWFEVIETRGQIADGKVKQYQVRLRAGFTLEEK
jgi:flavin-binding protein dodecin